MNKLWSVSIFCLVFGMVGCATEMSPRPTVLPEGKPVAFGRVHTELTGPTNRWYPPELRFFELVNLSTKERFRVDLKSADSPFFLSLPEGDYELTRIQINEGAFRAMAQLNPTFNISSEGLNYLGKWQVNVHPPTYMRLVDISVNSDLEAAKDEVLSLHPELADHPIVAHLPTPEETETRLVEMSPYPRVWWFCRHLTC